MNAERLTYLDSSAIVKLVIPEAESPTLRRYVNRQRQLVSSALARAEVGRTISDHDPRTRTRGAEVMARINLIGVSGRVLEGAANMAPGSLRTLDAIHLATARLLGDEVARIITYDERMADAARALGWTVMSPA